MYLGYSWPKADSTSSRKDNPPPSQCLMRLEECESSHEPSRQAIGTTNNTSRLAVATRQRLQQSRVVHMTANGIMGLPRWSRRYDGWILRDSGHPPAASLPPFSSLGGTIHRLISHPSSALVPVPTSLSSLCARLPGSLFRLLIHPGSSFSLFPWPPPSASSSSSSSSLTVLAFVPCADAELSLAPIARLPVCSPNVVRCRP